MTYVEIKTIRGESTNTKEKVKSIQKESVIHKVVSYIGSAEPA